MSEIMVDEEVENILAEIRDRVRGRELADSPNSTADIVHSDRVSAVSPVNTPRTALDTSANEVLARIDAYLTVTSRAWDRLPPLVSNRSGSNARIELWVKRQMKRVTNWFTWEQVNFNAAVHHALGNIVEALNAYQQALDSLRAETEAQRSWLEEQRSLLEGQRSMLEVQRSLLEKHQLALKAHQEDLQAERARVKAQLADLETQRAAQSAAQVAAQHNEMDERLSAITREMRERVEHLQDEQRVCFKQLSLEATEAAVLEDRARRQTEKMIEEVRARLDQLKQ